MKYLTPSELVNWAKGHSPFYQSLYEKLSTDYSWEEVPIVEQEHFWDANSWKENQLLTSKNQKGILFKSGGTTGKPKFSYYSKDEWNEFCRLFGESIGEANLEDGDHVGNMFYAGELYASFLFIHKSLELCPRRIIQFPLAGKMSLEDVVSNIKEFQINVLCGVPTSFLQLAKYCIENSIDLPIRKLLYGGEALYKDQEDLLTEAFGSVSIHSVGYASVDGGMLGRRSEDCRGTEHRPFTQATLMEIVDEEGSLIKRPGVEGRLLLTNLTRKLMPIIRYPVGDQAEWIEVNEKFKICGRSQEGARIGPITFNRDDLISIFKGLDVLDKISHFQMLITHFSGRDLLQIKIVLKRGEEMNTVLLEDTFYEQRKMFKKAAQDKIVHPVEFKLCQIEDLFKNERTGKSPAIVDQRLI